MPKLGHPVVSATDNASLGDTDKENWYQNWDNL